MTMTSEERREVERRLRSVTEEELRYVFLEEILNYAVGGRCLDDEGDIDERLILNRLADLIGRQMCRNEGSGNRFVCSACHYKFADDSDYAEDLDWAFCPNCGAEVIDEDSAN